MVSGELLSITTPCAANCTGNVIDYVIMRHPPIGDEKGGWVAFGINK